MRQSIGRTRGNITLKKFNENSQYILLQSKNILSSLPGREIRTTSLRRTTEHWQSIKWRQLWVWICMWQNEEHAVGGWLCWRWCCWSYSCSSCCWFWLILVRRAAADGRFGAIKTTILMHMWMYVTTKYSQIHTDTYRYALRNTVRYSQIHTDVHCFKKCTSACIHDKNTYTYIQEMHCF